MTHAERWLRGGPVGGTPNPVSTLERRATREYEYIIIIFHTYMANTSVRRTTMPKRLVSPTALLRRRGRKPAYTRAFGQDE